VRSRSELSHRRRSRTRRRIAGFRRTFRRWPLAIKAAAWSPIASTVFYNGDTSTVVLPALDLATSTAVSPTANYEQLAADLRGNVAYVMATATDTSIPSFGTGTITQLRAISATGAFSGARVMLSRAIAFSGSTWGIYSGYGRIIVYMGAGADMGYWQIEVPSGVVTRLDGEHGPVDRPSGCERSGHWGIAEFFGGDHYVVYVRSSPAGIVRQRVRDGMSTVVLMLPDVGDACTLAFSSGAQPLVHAVRSRADLGAAGHGLRRVHRLVSWHVGTALTRT
jgi:hypothetical protein